MRVAVTGATGFLGRYLVRELLRQGHGPRCWYRPRSDRSGPELADPRIAWSAGSLSDPDSMVELVRGCQGVIHAAVERSGGAFRAAVDDLPAYLETNLLGSLRLVELARRCQVERFVFLSSCAVHEVILEDRPLDEAHPTWALSHYGAYKAAVENFVCSLGRGEGYPVCALRPTGIYGLAHPPAASKWYSLVRSVVRGEPVQCRGGGKEVHAADVAKAAVLLLTAPGVAGQVYNCYDRYVSQWEVAHLARQVSGSASAIDGAACVPRHQILTNRLRGLGMQFGGRPLLEATVAELVAASRAAG